ncbi:MAG TPA: TonB-dependent receptor [Thermoanaerobaculia bacterium]|nr:TonB-dependent receptor [Thermoanaerobaculia bacterium]
MKSFRILVAVALLVAASVALAGETGSISGKVADANGGPLPGVMVKVSGPQLPAGRTFVTGATGAYNFQRLAPGKYTVEASLQGLGQASKTVDVQVDRDYQIELVLKGSTAATIEVTASTVDQRSAEVATNFATEEVRQLPVARSYEGLLNLIPNAPASDGTSGYVAVGGGTRQENKYLIDGVNITNAGYGNLGVETNELDIADVNVKTGAISAESGRTTGAIVNAVTKSGTNEFRGSFRLEGRPASFESANKYATSRDIDYYTAAAGLGFPIVKDTLFGYVSARYADSKTSGQSATVAGTTTTQPDTKTTNWDYFGKLTAYAGEHWLINAGYRGLPTKTTNGFDSSYDLDTAGWSQDNTNSVGNLAVNWFAGQNTLVEIKYVHSTDIPTVQANSILTARPSPLPQTTNLGAYGAFYDTTRGSGNTGVYAYTNTGEEYVRDEVKLVASQFLDWGETQHQVKVGGGAEFIDFTFARQSNGWGTMSYSGTTQVRARYYEFQPQQLGKARTYSAFLQDTITWKRLSATVGVLFNFDDFAQICEAGMVCSQSTTAPPLTETVRYNFMNFKWTDQIQPRIGVVYNTELLPGDKVYANYGKYQGLDQKNTVRSFAPYRIRENQTFWLKSTGAFVSSGFRGSSSGKKIPQDLASPYQDEMVVGYEAPLGKALSFDVHYQYKSLHNPFEDAPIDPNNYFGSFQAQTFPNATRIYRGYSLEVTKRYANSWFASVGYTYSRLRGNWDEDFAAGQYSTSSYLEDEPGYNSAEPNRYGTLLQDRPHIFKAMASYDLYGFTLGGYLRVQSGRAWEARGATPSTTSGRYLEPAGSRRYPTWTNFDMLLAYNFNLGGNMALRLEGRALNLFDDQEVTGVNITQYLDGYKDGVPPSTLGPQGTTQPNPQFAQATSWAAPRRFVLSALLTF